MYIKKTNQNKIKTIFYTKDQIIKEYWFKITSTIKDIFNYFENHIKDEGYSLKSSYKIFGKKINEYYTISELIKREKNDIVIDGEIWLEVEEDLIFDDDNDEIFYTILQPKVNPFELIEYNSLKSKIKIIQCNKDVIHTNHLSKFTKESAFCNSINSLYISGGEFYGKAINNFWIINKHNYKINKKYMPIYKKYHSMVYIPDNFIFIAGGDSLNTTIYDIENEEFINWANMNKKHFQPGLLIYGDYLYAFETLNDINEKNNYFEKTNLTSKNPKWEILYPKYDTRIKMNSSFFGISKFSEGNILFVGGEKNNPNYIYNPIDNIITISEGKNSSIPFWDKTFYKISKKYNLCIPLSFSNNYKLAFLDKEKESLIEVNCDKNTGNINFNIEGEDNPGNIYIQSTISNGKTNKNVKIQIGINPKHTLKKFKNEFNYIYESKINNNNNKQDNLKEKNDKIGNLEVGEEILNNYDDNYKNRDNLTPLKYYKNHEKKSYFYIPESFVDEQIINREVNVSNNKKDDNNKNQDLNIDEAKIIINKNENKENLNPSKYYKNYSKKIYLYIPESFVDGQIINREVNISENKNDENEKLNNIYDNKDKKDLDKNINDKLEDNFSFTGNLNDENEKYNPSHKNHPPIIKQYLYIPTGILEDQIIKRVLILNKNEDKDGNNIENKSESKNENKIINLDGKENINDKKETIINYENNFEQNDNGYKIKTNKNILLIPYSTIDDRIIFREIEINGKVNKIKKILTNLNDDSKLKKGIESYKPDNIKNSDYSEDNNLYDSRIIYLGTDHKDEIGIKKYTNGLKIYIPEYIIEDRIINREIISNNK